jgi:PAS domain S-box-containing protein
MILDVRTMYIAMAAICFIVAAALLTLQTRRSRRDGALQWALGWALQGSFWVLVGLRGIIGDFLSIVIAHTFLVASYSLLYAAVRQFQGRTYNTGILLFPVAATFIFFWYFSAYADNLLYRIIFISILSILQTGSIVRTLLRNPPAKERLSYWLTGFAFLMMAVVWLNRLLEALTLPYGQLSILQATTFRNTGVIVSLGVVVLSSIGFLLMIRERADEALRESEEHYHSLFDNMLNGYAYCKMLFDQGKPKDFIYLNVNNAFEILTGLKNVTGRKVSEVIPGIEKSDHELFEIYGRVALTGTPERFERYVEALGMWFSISVYSPRKEYFVAIFDVITERKRMEQTLRESEERYRTLFEKSLDAVILTDPSGKGKILSANPAACRMFGRTEQEMVRLSRDDLFAPHQPELENLIKGREKMGRYTGELTYRRRIAR